MSTSPTANLGVGMQWWMGRVTRVHADRIALTCEGRTTPVHRSLGLMQRRLADTTSLDPTDQYLGARRPHLAIGSML